MKNIWKTLRQEKPIECSTLYILTRNGQLHKGYYYDGDFYTIFGPIRKIRYKRWCYEFELVREIKKEIEDRH